MPPRRLNGLYLGASRPFSLVLKRTNCSLLRLKVDRPIIQWVIIKFEKFFWWRYVTREWFMMIEKNLSITYLILEFWKKNFADNKNDFNFSKFQSIWLTDICYINRRNTSLQMQSDICIALHMFTDDSRSLCARTQVEINIKIRVVTRSLSSVLKR